MWYLLSIAAATTVYFVPHSHVDVGWIDTTSYYYTEHGLQVMQTMLQLLEENPQRKFCWSEAFFFVEWIKQFPEVKPRIKKLIKEGRLEIAGGGWVMNDEALTDFESVARQIEAGHNFFREELEVKEIKVAWQLDPFGHSSLTPALFEKLGFEYMVMSRIDGSYREQMRKHGDMEFLWKSTALGSKHGLFTHLLYDHYSLPDFLDDRKHSRCFSDLFSFTPDIPNCLIALQTYIDLIKPAYKTENILILYGDDIHFKDYSYSKLQFELIEVMRDSSQALNIKIATPSEYFKAVMAENKTFKVFEGDLLPYVSEHIRGRPISWTGFYSSRAGLKQKVFEVQSLVRSAEILMGLVENKDFNANEVSVMMHHDAITGTCHRNTAKDYFERLGKDEKIAEEAIGTVFETIRLKAEKSFVLAVPYKVFVFWNSINWSVRKLAKIKVKKEFVKVLRTKGAIESQMVAVNGENFVFFQIELPALSFVTVFLAEVGYGCAECSFKSVLNATEIVENGKLTLQFDSGFIESVKFKGDLLFFASKLVKYDARHGGAYEFRPLDSSTPTSTLKSFEVHTGPILAHITSTFDSSGQTFTQKVLLPNSSDFFTLTFNLLSKSGEEIFLKFFNTNNKKNWFSTFNTADIIKRHLFQERMDCFGENGFPVVGAMLIDYQTTHMQVFPRFPLGVHMKNDYFELHLHRNPESDDLLGLGSALRDKVPAEHEFFITFGELNSSRIWKNYLNHKNSPQLFAVNSAGRLSLSLDQAELMKKPWNDHTSYSFGSEDQCSYLSRVFFTREEMRMSVLNTCEHGDHFEMDGAKLKEEVQADGFPITKREAYVEVKEKLEFGINQNTPDTLWKYYDRGDSDLGPFRLYTFSVAYNKTGLVQAVPGPVGDFLHNRVTISGAQDVNFMFVSVVLLFTLSVVLVLFFSIMKMRSVKKLD